MNKETKRMLEAAFWTFAQAFIGALALGLPTIAIGRWDELIVLASSGATAGLAALLSLAKSFIVRKISATDSIFLTGMEDNSDVAEEDI